MDDACRHCGRDGFDVLLAPTSKQLSCGVRLHPVSCLPASERNAEKFHRVTTYDRCYSQRAGACLEECAERVLLGEGPIEVEGDYGLDVVLDWSSPLDVSTFAPPGPCSP